MGSWGACNENRPMSAPIAGPKGVSKGLETVMHFFPPTWNNLNQRCQVSALFSPPLPARGFEQVHPCLLPSAIHPVPPPIRQPPILNDDPAVDHVHRHIGAARGVNQVCGDRLG